MLGHPKVALLVALLDLRLVDLKVVLTADHWVPMSVEVMAEMMAPSMVD